MDEDRTEEDRIIDNMVLEGTDGLYEDLDFIPARQSLYNSEKMIPEYDDEVFQQIVWCRPHEIADHPMYFDPNSRSVAVNQGSLPDEVFLGILMAISVYSKYDLIENVFASRPNDFQKYGVYTCRFYVNGEWVEVITDTMIPCQRDVYTSELHPVYGHSIHRNEMWINLVEKAFAKALGSYEAVSTIKVQKALLHLTGGSVQQYNLRDEVGRMDALGDQHSWSEFKNKLSKDGLLLLLPEEKKADLSYDNADHGAMEGAPSAGADAGKPMVREDYFVPNHLYSVVMVRDIGGYELVLMHNPWNHEGYAWTGEWSDQSNDWDLYPELQVELEKDPSIPWKRSRPNGFFWISFRQLVKHFNRMYHCLIFPNDKYNFYCVRGECRGRQAGGPLNTLRDRDVVLKEAHQSRVHALQKATAAAVIDGDSSWFNNPQYRIHATSNATVYFSIIPLGNGEDGDAEQAQMSVTVLSSAKHSASSLHVPLHLWEVSQFEVVGTDKFENGPIIARGQETSIWQVEVDHRHYYHIVPNTPRRGKEGDFILRVFSSRPLYMETIPPISLTSIVSEWKRVGDLDTTGGPPSILQADGTKKDNPKFCQNPQYHLQIANPYGKDEVYLKVVVRKQDHRQGHSSKSNSKSGSSANNAAADEKRLNAMVGLVVSKAEVLDETAGKSKKKQPRQNKLGEPIPTKESSLRRRRDDESAAENNANSIAATPKTILRKLGVDETSYYAETTFSSKNEACIFYPKLPRAWIPNGLLLIPCLNDKGIKAGFELEVYCSEEIVLTPLPEQYSRSISGEWTETTSGGCHIYPNWKKNPKFTLRFHNPVTTDAPARMRITLAKHGTGWKNMSKRDTVGCMIGFYIFVVRGTEQQQVYESTFVPDEEFSTDPSFSLPQLAHGETYMLMPATFGDGKVGAFVISILCEYEFHISKDK